MSKPSSARIRLLKAMPSPVIRSEHGYIQGSIGITATSLGHAKHSMLIEIVRRADSQAEFWQLTERGRAVLAKAEEAADV